MSGKRKGPGKSKKGIAKVRSKTPQVESFPATPDVPIPSVIADISSAIDALISEAKRRKTESISEHDEDMTCPTGSDMCSLCDFISRRKSGKS